MRPAFGVDIAIIQANTVLLIQRADMPMEGNLAMSEVVRHMSHKPDASDEILELTQFDDANL